MPDPQAASAEAATPDTEQRVACPSCGRLLCKIKMVKEADSAAFLIEIKCKSGGCHKVCQLNYTGGQFSVAVLAPAKAG